MRSIRYNVFETNSSSTHSMAIPNKKLGEYPNCIHFGIGKFGWEFACVDPANYLYTAIYCYKDREEAEETIERIKGILEQHSIKYTMEEPNFSEYGLDNGYIDHANDLGEFLDAVLSDDETILNFIFYGEVFTGNDNSDSEERCFIKRNEEFYEEYDWRENPAKVTEEKNPYYEERYAKDYDWYYKGN